MTGDSTIDYYHERKRDLMKDIIEENMPVEFDEDDEPFCQICRRKHSEVAELHVEHPNGDSEKKEAGGWQRLYKYERQFEEGETLWVVCFIGHYLLHRKRDDANGERLAGRRPELAEGWGEREPEVLLRQRRMEGMKRAYQRMLGLDPDIEPSGVDEESEHSDIGTDSVLEQVRDQISGDGVDEQSVYAAIDAPDEEVSAAISELKQQGDVFVPRQGVLCKL